MVKVFSKPSCPQCVQTKKFLERHDIDFEEIDIMSDPAMAKHLRESGQLQMPHVVTDIGSWSGFRIGKLKELLQ